MITFDYSNYIQLCFWALTIMHITWIIIQTNYKMITKNWFWLYTYTLLCIFIHSIVNHWSEQTCQSWICFIIYKWLVQISSLDDPFYFGVGHVSPSWFIFQPLLIDQLISLWLLQFGLIYEVTSTSWAYSLIYCVKLLQISNKLTTKLHINGFSCTLTLQCISWISLTKPVTRANMSKL